MKRKYLLGALIIFAVIWFVIPQDKPKHLLLQSIKHPQEYMSKISMWSYNEEGHLKHELYAKHWAYLPETNASQLTTPHLTVYKPDQTLWHIDAEKGKILQPTLGAIDQVELSENVIVERPETPAALPLKLETTVLRYQPKTEYVETDQFITLTKPDLKITGIGMRAFLDKGFVELLEDVKTYYVATDH